MTALGQPTAGEVTDKAAVAKKLENLHRACSRPLLTYLVKLTLGDRRLAEDIMQETFVRAWTHMQRHDDVDVDTFRPWLYTVARRLVIDAVRARKARPVEVAATDLGQLVVVGDHAGSLSRVLAIREALMRLQPSQRKLLIDLYHHGRTPKELAEELNIPVGTVKSRAYYAKRALQSYHDQEDG